MISRNRVIVVCTPSTVVVQVLADVGDHHVHVSSPAKLQMKLGEGREEAATSGGRTTENRADPFRRGCCASRRGSVGGRLGR